MISEQITDIYLSKETWHRRKLSRDDANYYHEYLLNHGNILFHVDDDNVIGYLEFWRLDYEQFGRIMCGKNISPTKEDVINGPIVYINNMYIDSDYRGGEAFDTIAGMLLGKNIDAEYFTASRRTKKSEPVLVYSRKDLIKLYHKKGA